LTALAPTPLAIATLAALSTIRLATTGHLPADNESTQEK
jgi:hypothetical protein